MRLAHSLLAGCVCIHPCDDHDWWMTKMMVMVMAGRASLDCTLCFAFILAKMMMGVCCGGVRWCWWWCFVHMCGCVCVCVFPVLSVPCPSPSLHALLLPASLCPLGPPVRCPSLVVHLLFSPFSFVSLTSSNLVMPCHEVVWHLVCGRC